MKFLIKVCLFNLIYFIERKTLKIGNRVTDFFTREEYNNELIRSGMIDINV